MAKVRMRDVGAKLGVSTVTVSKALNGKDGVSEEVRARIVEAAKQMGYEIDAPVVVNRHISIGVLVGHRFYSEDDAFYSKVYTRLIQVAHTLNITVLLEIVSREYEDNCILPKFIQNKQIEGLIYLGSLDDNYINYVNSQNVPYIYLDFYNNNKMEDSVVSDNYSGSYAITKLLINKGHKDIRFIGRIEATSSIFDRYMGYLKAIIEFGLLNETDITPIPDRNERGKAYKEYELTNISKAYVCNCDLAAFYLKNSLIAKGYKIPEDVSITGFDDSYFATISSPELTTYKVNIKALTTTALQLLLRKINGETDFKVKKIVSGDIIERASVKKLN